MEKKIEQIAVKRGYVVTEEGVLLNPKGKEIGVKGGNRYVRYNITINKSKKSLLVHRLQAYQKYGDRLFEKGIVVRHKDGKTSNNSWENVLIGTQSENMMDIPEQIRIKKAKHATSFIKKFNHKNIIEDRKKGMTYAELMEKYNISSKGTIGYIIRNSSESKTK